MKTINNFISEKLKITKNMINNQQNYVDLGLPSGTLWAKRNVGADEEHEYGDYFAWGETETKEEYIWKTYKFGDEKNIIKYNDKDNLIELELKDDVAYTCWMKDDWNMPTKEQFEELKEHTKHKWIEDYNDTGINGRLFTGKNGNTLFLPAAGLKHKNVVRYRNTDGQYWSKNLYTDECECAFGFEFNSKYTTNCTVYRCCGYSVRPVLNK